MYSKYTIKESISFLSKIIITSTLLLMSGFGSILFLSIPIMLFDWIFSIEIMNYLTEIFSSFSLVVKLIIVGLIGIPVFVSKDGMSCVNNT